METVSEEVVTAAKKWAEENTYDHYGYIAAINAFIAGAYYSKPIEHEQKPINGNGKESENNPDSI